MRVSATILGFVAATSLMLSPAVTEAHGAASPNKPPTSGKPTTSGKPVASPMTRSTGKPTSSGKPVASTTHSTGKPTTIGKPTKSRSGKPTAMKGAATTSGSRSTSKHTGPTSTAKLNPIAAKIASKPHLNAKLNGMLPIDPMTGRTMTLNKASLGFKNQGQFIAAMHVSQNIGIPFTELKSHMVTVTPGAPGKPPMATQTGSLGQAIQASKRIAGVTTEVERAERQTSADLRTTSSTPSSTSSRSPLPKNKTTKKTTTPHGAG